MYFSVWFSTRLSFSHSFESQTAKAKAVLLDIKFFTKAWWCFSDYLKIFLFDSQIMPILLYGSEIWGMQMDLQLENAHLFALKKQKQNNILNVSPIPKHQTM